MMPSSNSETQASRFLGQWSSNLCWSGLANVELIIIETSLYLRYGVGSKSKLLFVAHPVSIFWFVAQSVSKLLLLAATVSNMLLVSVCIELMSVGVRRCRTYGFRRQLASQVCFSGSRRRRFVFKAQCLVSMLCFV